MTMFAAKEDEGGEIQEKKASSPSSSSQRSDVALYRENEEIAKEEVREGKTETEDDVKPSGPANEVHQTWKDNEKTQAEKSNKSEGHPSSESGSSKVSWNPPPVFSWAHRNAFSLVRKMSQVFS